MMATTAVASLLAFLAVVRPWSNLDDSVSLFTAVAHAYDGLYEFETVHYRVDGDDSFGQRSVTTHKVDMVNHIHYWATWPGTDPASNAPSGESITIEGKAFDRNWASNGEWMFSRETKGWDPFGDLGGLPWSSEVAADRFDRIEKLGEVEIDGLPVVHYRATRRLKPTSTPGYVVTEFDIEGSALKSAKTVHRGADDYTVYVDTVDIWITAGDGTLVKADWTQIEKAPDPPADLDERDWCQGIGEFVDPQYYYRPRSGSLIDFHAFDAPMDSEDYELAKVICWNGDQSEGRVPWGRSLAEQIGQDFWIKWEYTFIAFNETFDLPNNLPE
ncbi:MAG: hypothetical protein OYI31_00655 [Chloroflexota bacterium]|nr:hypothetical protein [Chloroflexota bacterium]MDE2940782.1 hypothetical protein [Chloroflexota bacterium]MDE3266964.1 hypothetical protein [Chloroflexota bacterium]